MNRHLALLCAIAVLTVASVRGQDPVLSGGLLYPEESPSRERRDLSGVWNFRASPQQDQQVGFRDQWYSRPLHLTGDVIPMPVPSSYNDITQDPAMRDYIGWVWYDKEFFIPSGWEDAADQRVLLHFGSAHYTAMVWLNGISVVNHSIGHLPFQADVTGVLNHGTSNRVTVALNSTLTSDTVPQGSVTYYHDTTRYPEGFYEASYNFDFSNYAGIHRPVYLYTTPLTYIDDITITTDIDSDGTTGLINFDVEHVEEVEGATSTLSVEVYDKNGTLVTFTTTDQTVGTLTIPNAHLWWPYLMDPNPGYLYTLKVILTSAKGDDVYYQKIGIRTVTWSSTTFNINGKPFYFRGFGKHEDSNIRGKGVDHALIVKDFNLIKWVGANSFRTSHYPYAEEILDRADAEGIVVIGESPACTLNTFGDALLANHKQAMAEMLRRDKNRASIVMWSMGNEPDSSADAAGPYFESVFDYTKSLDAKRPVTLVLDTSYSNDKAARYLDIICINRYDSWYSDTGHLDVIKLQMESELTDWHAIFQKPIMTSEYGADSVVGLHTSPPYVFTEDYQVALMIQNFEAFDNVRGAGFFIGEMIWNFADFMTPQGTTRVVGNKKGIFTRERQPKAAAHVLRSRYFYLASILDNVTDPENEKTPLAYCPNLNVIKT